jgi:diguanylate cyclase (GGDEF)-like protein
MKEVMVWTCHMMESQINGSRCSIMLLDDSGKTLQMAAGPSLPDEYKARIDGIAIGQGMGSCGTAAMSGEPVIVSDIQQHPYWADYATLAGSHGLRACWSYPIKAHDGSTLGTFAIYFEQPCTPDAHCEHITQRTSHLMAIAIQQERRANQLFQLATQDALTGLLNRRHFMTLAEQACSNTQLLPKPLSMLMFDLDHFKQVNDRYGHAAGDDALRAFATTLQDSLRSQDLICRMGGEEFAALLMDTAQEDAMTAAQRICKLVAHTPVLSQGQSIPLTVSIGLATRSEGQTLGDMMRQADKALYQAKHTGRNRVYVAGQPGDA